MKSERTKTHPGGVAARGGSFGRFRAWLSVVRFRPLWRVLRVRGILILSAAFVALWAFCGVLRGQKKSRPALSPGGKFEFMAVLSFPPLHTGGEFFGRRVWDFDKLAAVRGQVIPKTETGQRLRSFGVYDVSGVLSSRTA